MLDEEDSTIDNKVIGVFHALNLNGQPCRSSHEINLHAIKCDIQRSNGTDNIIELHVAHYEV